MARNEQGSECDVAVQAPVLRSVVLYDNLTNISTLFFAKYVRRGGEHTSDKPTGQNNDIVHQHTNI